MDSARLFSVVLEIFKVELNRLKSLILSGYENYAIVF